MNRKDYCNYISYISACLTKEERAEICNQCGTQENYSLCGLGIIKAKWFKLPYSWFKLPCDWHDVAYAAGGDERHRKWADKNFRKLSAWYLKPIALIAYGAIRIKGAKSFNYTITKNPVTLDQLRESRQISPSVPAQTA